MKAEPQSPADLRLALLGSDPESIGEALHGLARRLYPICRSITGSGVRASLELLSEVAEIDICEVPSGRDVLDWTIPKEWAIHDAYIADTSGRRLIDFNASSLHVLNYSAPIDAIMTFEQLRPHLHTLPGQPELIPYRTSYYNENWGFCLSQKQLDGLGPGPFAVRIQSELFDGSLTLGEIFLPGSEDGEALISTHICHPSLANDNLSGLVIAAALALRAKARPKRIGLRILFVPGTIGSVAWLSQNEPLIARVAYGLVLTGLGDRGNFSFKRSRRGTTLIDRVAAHVMASHDPAGRVLDFSPWGYDERQYCSPGFDMPVGRLSRTPHGEYPEYHTSGDNLSFITGDSLARALLTVEEILSIAESDRTYISTSQKGEPRLGKRGLYRSTAGQGGSVPDEIALLWLLNQSDGANSLLDISNRSGLAFERIHKAALALEAVDLLKPARWSAQ